VDGPVVVDDDLDADDSVLLVLDPEKIQHERHDLRRVWLERFVVRQTLDDLEQGMTQFLVDRRTKDKTASSATVLVNRQQEKERTCSPVSLVKTGVPVRSTSVKAGRRMSR
jgi:hypothetical protein